MRRIQAQRLYRWSILFTLCAAALTLQCCGREGAKDPLQIELAVPPGENADSFWYGVQNRSLHVVPQKGNPVDIPWQSGALSELELRSGDKITFLGTDQNGLLLVTGDTTVGEEKKATIPLHRVL